MKQIYKLLLSSFSLLIGFTSLSQSITRGPYLQKGTETSVVVKWKTNITADTQIEYSLDENFSSSTFVPSSNPSISKNHQVEITGLSPYTKYYYRIPGSNLIESPDLFFKTHPVIGTSGPYIFWFLGNTYQGGINNGNAVNVRNQYYSYIGSADTDGILFLGDNAGSGDSGTDPEYQDKVFDMYDSKLKNTITWSCIGNLDTWINPDDLINGDYPYYDIFEFPKFGESGGIQSNTESYYSFDYGNIHFIVLNSVDENRDDGENQGTSPGPMYTWAKNDIQSTEQKWIIALWHQPPFSHGWHNSDTGLDGDGSAYEPEMKEMRENFLPMLEDNGVDLVVTAHSLVYERSYFIKDFYEISDNFDLETYAVGATGSGDGKTTPYHKTSIGDNAGLGTVYTVSSTASISAVSGPLDHSAMFYSSSQLGSCILEVEGNNLTLKFLRDNGNIDDEFTIRKDYVYDNGWQGGTDPNGIATNVEDILIKSGEATITSNTTTNAVFVNPGAGLTINTGSNLSIGNSLNLNSSSDSYSSLILDGSISGTGTVNYNRFTNIIGSGVSGGNDLVSPPLSGQSFVAFAAANPKLASHPTNISVKAFAPYNTDSGNYENYDIDELPGNTATLVRGKGYRAATTDGSPLLFTGVANKGTINDVSILAGGVGSGWNLVGNPYPSYLKAKEFLQNSTNAGLLNENNVSIYGYNADPSSSGGIWTIVNLANIGATTGPKLAPGQGFFVKAQFNGDLEFTNIMRTHGTSDDFIIGKNTNTSNVLSMIKLSKGLKDFNTDIYFIKKTSRGLDPGYDAGAYQGNAEGIFTNLVEENSGIEMAIQALPYKDYNNVVVPLGIKADSGTQLTISIDETSTLSSNVNIYLEDNVANTFSLLNKGGYSITPRQDLTGAGRFFLHYTSSTLSLENEDISGLQIFTTEDPKMLFVNGKLKDTSILDLYDIQGRLVLNKKLNNYSNSNTIRINSFKSGVYIVKLKNGSLTLTKKIIIR